MSALKTVIVAPMISRGGLFPTRIPLVFNGKNGLILLDQMRAVDKSRLIRKLGTLPECVHLKIIDCLHELFAQ